MIFNNELPWITNDPQIVTWELYYYPKNKNNHWYLRLGYITRSEYDHYIIREFRSRAIAIINKPWKQHWAWSIYARYIKTEKPCTGIASSPEEAKQKIEQILIPDLTALRLEGVKVILQKNLPQFNAPAP